MQVPTTIYHRKADRLPLKRPVCLFMSSSPCLQDGRAIRAKTLVPTQYLQNNFSQTHEISIKMWTSSRVLCCKQNSTWLLCTNATPSTASQLLAVLNHPSSALALLGIQVETPPTSKLRLVSSSGFQWIPAGAVSIKQNSYLDPIPLEFPI